MRGRNRVAPPAIYASRGSGNSPASIPLIGTVAALLLIGSHLCLGAFAQSLTMSLDWVTFAGTAGITHDDGTSGPNVSWSSSETSPALIQNGGTLAAYLNFQLFSRQFRWRRHIFGYILRADSHNLRPFDPRFTPTRRGQREGEPNRNSSHFEHVRLRR